MANHKLLKQDRLFENAASKIDFLVLGHSRAAKAVDLTQLSNSVNFCSGGESNIQSYYKIKHILEKTDKEIGTIILPSGFGTFNLPSRSINSNSFYWKKYVSYLRLGHELNEFYSYLGMALKAYLVPWYEYPYLKASVMLGDFNLKIDKFAFVRGDESERDIIARSVIERSFFSRQLYHETSIAYLEKTIALCKLHDLDVVFVMYPVSTSYQRSAAEMLDSYSMQKQVLRVDSILINDDHIQFLDMHNYFNHDDRKYFVDPQHLNSDGAYLFTKEMVRRLK